MPDIYADETINRVMRKIHEVEDVNNLLGYIYGVAKLVPSGDYVLLLLGKGPEGSFVKVAEHSFKVPRYNIKRGRTDRSVPVLTFEAKPLKRRLVKVSSN